MNHAIPRITVDAVLITHNRILLIERKNPPFQQHWALPGGFVDYGETTEAAVQREMMEETGLKVRICSLVGVFSDPQRDPRGHTISIVYRVAQVSDGEPCAGDDAQKVKFFSLDALPDLAFDHSKIIKIACS